MNSTISGFVLTGGKSTRFGSSKVIHRINDVPMGIGVLNNLQSAIAAPPSFVGSFIDHPDFANHLLVSGDREGQGPLGAICDVLERAATDYVVFSPCDTPYFTAVDFKNLIENRHDYDVVVAADQHDPHHRHWLLSVWNISTTRRHMIDSFASGERAIHRAISGLNVGEHHFSNQALTNVNTPLDTQ